MIVDRDEADARAIARALTDPVPGEKDEQPGSDLARTLKLLRDHLLRRDAEDHVPTLMARGASKTPSADDARRRK